MASQQDFEARRKVYTPQRMTVLPEDFIPGENDVICGRGKKCYNHIGNERFRVRVVGMLDEYSKAKSKLDKSGVLASVVDQVRALSPDGGFVKQNDDGRWFEVGDFLAREKTSQTFRDALHERYKSSNVSKKKRRKEEQAKATDKFQRIARSYSDNTSSRLEWLGLSNEARSASHPATYEFMQEGDAEAAQRLQRLTDMRQRLHRRFAPRVPPVPRPNSALSMRYPDPLFGSVAGAGNVNAFPVGEGSFGGSTMRDRFARSMPASPARFHVNDDLPLTFEEEMDPLDLVRVERADDREEQAMHHSMPNIHVGADWNPFGLNPGKSLHHSAPDLAYHDDEESVGPDLDPIPLDEMTPRPGAKKSISADDFKRAISMTLSPTSPSAETVSRDLIACLEKLTGSSIRDDNPFEPLPLSDDPMEPLDADRVPGEGR